MIAISFSSFTINYHHKLYVLDWTVLQLQFRRYNCWPLHFPLGRPIFLLLASSSTYNPRNAATTHYAHMFPQRLSVSFCCKKKLLLPSNLSNYITLYMILQNTSNILRKNSSLLFQFVSTDVV